MTALPGEWRGTGHESHLRLGAGDNAIVCAAHAKAASLQGDLNAAFQAVERGLAQHSGRLAGLDDSLKHLSSFQSKVARRTSERQSAAEVVGETRDLNRYTLTFPTDQYTDGVRAAQSRMQEVGFEPIPQYDRNTWNQPEYKGVNTTWRHLGTSQRVEVQFHTPESFHAAKANHPLHELNRSGALTPNEREACRHLQADRYRDVPIPPGHEQIADPGRSDPLQLVTEGDKQAVRGKAEDLSRQHATADTLGTDPRDQGSRLPAPKSRSTSEQAVAQRDQDQSSSDPTEPTKPAGSARPSGDSTVSHESPSGALPRRTAAQASEQERTQMDRPHAERGAPSYAQQAAADDQRIAQAMKSAEGEDQHRRRGESASRNDTGIEQ